jgi:hypothetical protein
MTTAPPDHLSNNPKNIYYDADALSKGVGIRFNGRERMDVAEYSATEGWIRVEVGKSRDRFGNPMTVKLKGTVEPFYREPAG